MNYCKFFIVAKMGRAARATGDLFLCVMLPNAAVRFVIAIIVSLLGIFDRVPNPDPAQLELAQL